MQPVTIEYSNDTAPAFKGHLNCIVSWASNDLLTFWTAYYYFCFPVPKKIPNELALYIALKGLRIAKKSKMIYLFTILVDLMKNSGKEKKYIT